MPNQFVASMKKWYAVGATGTLLLSAACGPISAKDAQGVLDTGREIQRLQQEEITPRLDAITELQQEIEPLETRLREIKKEFRGIERDSIGPMKEDFKESNFGPDHELIRELEEEMQARMHAIDEEQRELDGQRRDIETALHNESRGFEEQFKDVEKDKSDRMREIDEELRDLHQGTED